MDISATHNAKGGSFGYNNNLWVGGQLHACVHICMCDELSLKLITC